MTAIVLFCALSIAPQDCQMTTGRHFPVEAVYRTPLECQRDAQMWAAVNLSPPRPGEYVKISCVRSSFIGNG